MKSYFATKMLALGGVMLALLFALNMIQGVVNDRQLNRSRAIASVGSPQTLVGPLLALSCVERWDEQVKAGNETKTVERDEVVRVLSQPESLVMKSGVDIDPRARGLHRVNAYGLKMQMSGRWSHLDSLKVKPHRKNGRLSCDAPVLMLAVTDSNGIRTANVKLNGQTVSLKAGTTHSHYPRGVHAALPPSLREGATAITADIDLELFGVEALSIVPVAEVTQLQMQSNWRHPSFAGNFLPADRRVDAQGFDASWRVSALASSVGETLRQGGTNCRADAEEGMEKGGDCLETIKISFVDPINPYSLSDRAVKYGLLFVILTFAAVGLFEVMQRLRVHPIQYFLVGSALSIFFLLLLSLSEHMAFNLAYLVAAGACVLLLGYYGVYMLRGFRRGLPFGLGIAVLYGLLFVLLQLEQTALIVGALALFAALAAVMYFTRKVDWYRLMNGEASA